jgi:hypothetical protein
MPKKPLEAIALAIPFVSYSKKQMHWQSNTDVPPKNVKIGHINSDDILNYTAFRQENQGLDLPLFSQHSLYNIRSQHLLKLYWKKRTNCLKLA